MEQNKIGGPEFDDKATEELRALFEQRTAQKYKPKVARGLHLKNSDGSFQVSSIEMEFHAWADGYRAAVAPAQPAVAVQLNEGSSMPVDMAQAKRWIMQLRNRVDALLAIINSNGPAPAAPSERKPLTRAWIDENLHSYFSYSGNRDDVMWACVDDIHSFARAIEQQHARSAP